MYLPPTLVLYVARRLDPVHQEQGSSRPIEFLHSILYAPLSDRGPSTRDALQAAAHAEPSAHRAGRYVDKVIVKLLISAFSPKHNLHTLFSNSLCSLLDYENMAAATVTSPSLHSFDTRPLPNNLRANRGTVRRQQLGHLKVTPPDATTEETDSDLRKMVTPGSNASCHDRMSST